MTAVAVLAAALTSPCLATLAVLVIVAGFAVRSLRRGGGRARGWAVPYFVTLGCLYLPFGWVVWEWPWDGYRRTWIQMWPVLPGLIGGMFVHPDDTLVLSVSGALSLALVALFTAVGRLGRRSLIVANAIALLGACLESQAAYALFLM
jgi:hypothetical protein